jgi:hypothetical protein
MKPKTMLLPFPAKGINQGWPKNAQPQLTTPDALNVITYEPNSDRARGGQRWGTAKAHPTVFDGGSIDRIIGMHAVAFQVAPATGTEGSPVAEVLYEKYFDLGTSGHSKGDEADDSELDTALYNASGATNVQSGVLVYGDNHESVFGVDYLSLVYDHSSGATLWMDAGETIALERAYAWINSNTLYVPQIDPLNVYQADNLRVTARFRARTGSSGTFSEGGIFVLANMSGPITTVGAGTETPSNYVVAEWDTTNGTTWTLELRYVISGTVSGNNATDTATGISATSDYHVQIERHGTAVTARVIDIVGATTVAECSVTLSSGEATSLNGGSQLAGFALTNYGPGILPPNPAIGGTASPGFKVELVIPGTTVETEIDPRQIKVVAQSKQTVYAGLLGGTMTSLGSVSTGSKPSMCDINQKVYYVNGTDTKVIDPAAETMGNLTATAGSIPTGCRIAVAWRSRLVLSQEDVSPQNVYMSRAGTPTDWDYNPAVPDALQAVALNASSSAGRIGQPVKALIPFKDDVLVIGCDHSLFAMVGDPADGGTITTISDSLGILQRDAWVIAPDGAIYFVGHGGFYMMPSPTSVPINLAVGVYEQFFSGLDRRGNYIMCQWDRDNEGCWIFVTAIETGTSTHLWYDSKLKAFWPQRFPNAHGPLATYLYDGDRLSDRYILLGGRDGYIRKIDPTALNDDGTPISSYVFIGPFNPYGPFGKAKLIELEGVTGEGTTNLVYEIRSGDDARAALAAAYDFQLSWTTVGRQPKVRQRARGNTMVLKLQNAVDLNRWSLERVAAMFEPSGKMR